MIVSSSEGTSRTSTARPTEPPPSWVPKSPWSDLPEPDHVLHGKRLVEAELLARDRDEPVPLRRRQVVALARPAPRAASPGRASEIAKVMIEIASRTAISERIGVRKRI